MTELRQFTLATRDFAAIDAELKESAWDQRKSLLVKELTDDLPSLRRLRSSTLEVAYLPTRDSVQMRAYVEESSQLNLSFRSQHDSGHDLYLQEIDRICKDQSELREAYETALKSSVNPANNPELSKKRQRLWRSRGAGFVHLHSSQAGEQFHFQKLPSTLPLCKPVSVLGKVLRITPKELQIKLLDDLPSAMEELVFSAGTKVALQRAQSVQGLQFGLLLATAMEKDATMRLKILVEHSWIDGSPNYVSLVGGQPLKQPGKRESI